MPIRSSSKCYPLHKRLKKRGVEVGIDELGWECKRCRDLCNTRQVNDLMQCESVFLV
jgi:hypothetical protein